MGVIIEFWRCEGTGVESNRMNFVRVMLNRKDSTKSIVRSISFDNKRSVRNPVRKNQSRGKGRLEGFK